MKRNHSRLTVSLLILPLLMSACGKAAPQAPAETDTPVQTELSGTAEETETPTESRTVSDKESETGENRLPEESAAEKSSRPDRNGAFGGPGGQRGGGGSADKSSDTELQAMIAEVAPKFELRTYEDPESGITLSYQLYIPENYDPETKYPLVQFIPDSSVVGRGEDAVLTQGWGGLIWASPEEQEKHPSFVVIPVFTETVVNDQFEHSGQIDAAVRLIRSLTETWSIDPDRIYTTGQSMGGMTSFYLNITYPELFAASLFVGSQWDNSLLSILEDRDFFYIVAAGDPKASAGQAGLMEVFDTDQAPYSHAEWSAQDPSETQDAAVETLLAEGNRANFITFTLGSTVPDGTVSSQGAGEHMTSFDYAYKLGAVRDWLFEQHL